MSKRDIPIAISQGSMLEPTDAVVMLVRNGEERRIVVRFEIDGENFYFLIERQRALKLGESIVRLAKAEFIPG